MTAHEHEPQVHKHLDPITAHVLVRTPGSDRFPDGWRADAEEQRVHLEMLATPGPDGDDAWTDTDDDPSWLQAYLARMRGRDDLPALKEVNPALEMFVCDRKTLPGRAKVPDLGAQKARVLWWSFMSSFIGIAILAAMQYSASIYVYPSDQKITTLIGSFGAMSILVFGAVEAPLAQPRNAILGNTLSAFIGVAIAKVLHTAEDVDEYMWLACALSVSLSMVAMQLTDTVHPPGGATALIAVTSPQDIQNLGFFYAVFPVFVGSCILVGVSVIFNNIQRQFPRYWLVRGNDGAPKEVNPAFDFLVCDRKTVAAHARDATLGAKKRRVLLWSFLSCFVGIATLAAMQYSVRMYFYPSTVEATNLIGSFGATAVLVFGIVDAPFAQPRNVIMGNSLSAFVGVCVAKVAHLAVNESYLWLACALAVSLSMVAMQLTDTLHPPAGATALLAVISAPNVRDLGFFYVICPVGVGSCIIVAISLVLNNIARQYPRYWLHAS
ncbi:HPP family protein [Achlya hypogyna]|uniref:HPP family protein n=1 Tax=Achlya hypogyna TaxID=1202772 RepID=A0A1V9ZMB6_ACHHY|nr:HPP family protein [Achlya hypogyna]